MRFLTSLCAAFLFFFLAVSIPAFSQEDKPAAQEERAKDKQKDRDRVQKEQPKEQPRHDDQVARPDENRRDENRQDRERPEASRPQQQSRPDPRPEGQMKRDHQQGQMEVRRGGHIPDDKFRANFGRPHHFHVDRARVYNQPQPVVVYGGYSFELIDVWPVEWSFDDDCYIDYDDGQYYLYDVFHPGIRIAVMVIE